MSTEYLSICVTHNFFRQYSYQCPGFVSPWWNLCLCIFIILCNLQMGLFYSFSFDISLLVYRYTKDFVVYWFCILQLSEFISSSSFLVMSLDFLYGSSHLQTKQFYFSFLILCFFFLPLLSKTSNTVLNKSMRVGILVLILELSRKVFQFFTTECDVSCGLFTYGLCYVEVHSLCAHFYWEGFLKIINGCWILSHALSESIELAMIILHFG